MKRVLSLFLAVFVLLSVPFDTAAEDETVLTLSVPSGTPVYSGEPLQDTFALAVGYSLAEDCEGLSGYAVTVTWDPNVFALNTDYTEHMSDSEMAACTGCYFRDLYGDGLEIAPPGTCVVNYRKVKEGQITVVSVSLENMPQREATLFVLDMIPLGNHITSEISVKVKEVFGLTSAEGMIENYRAETTLSVTIGTPLQPYDVNLDGILDIKDMQAVKRHVRGEMLLTDDGLSRADADGNLKIDGRDYLFICRELQS